MWVYLQIKDYSAMQWPCPDGFHIPLSTERQTVNSMGVSLWAWTSSGYTDISNYLKLPLAWVRWYSDWSVSAQWSAWYYWCSDASWWKAYHLLFNSYWIFDGNTTYKCISHSIRAFKNTPVIPDSSWTVLYQWTWTSWIYHNSTLWLISISSDGQTWETIADKNIWASQLNDYWYTYQRWNNNWFWWGSVTISSTQVNASTYWPWNYYSSSTFITSNSSPYDRSSVQNDNLWGWVTGVKPMSELKNAYIGEYVPPYLCFTANTASSTVKLNKIWSPTAVTLETSTDWTNWSTYTFWNTITLSNIWDKVYFRNTSTSNTAFSTSYSNYYQFVMTWSIAASWDITYLLNKNGTNTVNSYCYYYLFYGCDSLTSAPKLPATTLNEYCYRDMFISCTNITTLPKLPATTLYSNCYRQMFYWCTKIKLSTTQTWEYQTPYRIPSEWAWTDWTASLSDMFASTWWTFTWTPSINTTYYTSNTVV